MLRQLIALFALFTGFAVLAEPAPAHAASVENVRLAEGAALACQAQVAQQTARMAQRPPLVAPRRASCRMTRILLRIPAVMLKADRARE